jgi:RimJ/RimL family protein N-acetyltransferase
MADGREFLARCERQEPGNLILAMARRSDNRVSGNIGYEANGKGAAELGYCLAEPLWGQGLGREAATAMTDHAFGVSGHERLFAGYRHGNDASRRILARLGFIATHAEMLNCRATGESTPVVRMELTRENWLAAKGRRR